MAQVTKVELLVPHRIRADITHAGASWQLTHKRRGPAEWSGP